MSFGILPIEDIKSCVVSADKSADQNVENVPSGDVNKVQTSAEQSEVDFRTDKSANIGTKINHENVQKLHNDNLDKCNDLISRAEGIETVQSYLNILINSRRHGDDFTFINVLTDIRNKISALPSADVVSREDYHNLLMASNDIDRALREYQAKEEADADRPKGANLINRHDATTVIREECLKCNNLTNADLLGRILALPTSQQTDCTDFIMWLIEVVLDEEDWELNAVGYGEIIARKLKKLGLLEVKDGYYIRSSADRQTDESCQDCPIYSADRPTVIKSKTLMPTKDFKEWAKRIREVNPNAVVIPCDAEVMSADRPKGEWRWTHGGQCSECGFHNTNFDFNFCPNCGADMRKDADR